MFDTSFDCRHAKRQKKYPNLLLHPLNNSIFVDLWFASTVSLLAFTPLHDSGTDIKSQLVRLQFKQWHLCAGVIYLFILIQVPFPSSPIDTRGALPRNSIAMVATRPTFPAVLGKPGCSGLNLPLKIGPDTHSLIWACGFGVRGSPVFGRLSVKYRRCLRRRLCAGWFGRNKRLLFTSSDTPCGDD